MRPRWRGRRGRLEVWYSTLTDPVTGTGIWLHHELVAPTGEAPPYAHGWAAAFPTGGAPVVARFGPAPWQPPSGEEVFAAEGVTVSADRLAGSADALAWELSRHGGGAPLYTFPRWSWRRELLPAVQIVPYPSATFTGTVHIGPATLRLDRAPGNCARVYGHGNARRWGWLHADLGGGDVVEVVAGVSTRPLLRLLPPLPFVRLRLGGVEWPGGDPLVAALSCHAQLGLPTWTVRGRSGDARIRIEVTQPTDRTLSLDYRNPDGSAAVCHNTERADAIIVLQRIQGREWVTQRRWELDGTAHAEIGALASLPWLPHPDPVS